MNAPQHKPIVAVGIKSGDLHLVNSLKTHKKWFPDYQTLGIHVVGRRGTLKEFPGNTWIVSIERFLSLLD